MTSILIDFCKHDPQSAMNALLRCLPLSLAVREIMRMRALAEQSPLPAPLLDVGCGDGLFWEVAARSLQDKQHALLDGLIGIDVSDHELKLASLRLAQDGGEVRNVDISSNLQDHSIGDMTNMFRTIVANCSLEHVPRIEPALRNIKHYLHSDGRFFLFVPAPFWTDTLGFKRALNRWAPRMAGVYGALFDGFFRHYHLYPSYVWEYLLKGVGFTVEKSIGIGSFAANRLFDRWLFGSLPAFVFKAIFKRYPIWYTQLKSSYLKRRAPDFMREIETGFCVSSDTEGPDCVEYLFICRPS